MKYSNQTQNLNKIYKLYKLAHILGSFSVLGFLYLIMVLTFPFTTEITDTNAASGIPTESTVTISLEQRMTPVILQPSDPNGNFSSSESGKETTFSVLTDNYTGYTLSVTSDDDDGKMVYWNGEIDSIESKLTAEEFDTADNNNRWGFKPSKYQEEDTIIDNTGDDAVFLASPTTRPTILDVTATSNNEANQYTIGVGVRTNSDTPPGIFTKNIILAVLGNPITYSISFDGNADDTVTNIPETQTSSTEGTSVIIPTVTPLRTHYSFLGWCLGNVSTINGTDSCSGIVFGPGDSYGIDQTASNTVTLKALWKIDSFIQTTQVRYENADGSWGSYSTVETKNVNYGDSYSWSTSQIPGFNTAMYQSASVASYIVTQANTKQVSIYRTTFTCTKQYRLQDTSGNYPSSYTNDGTITGVRYGSSCSYTTNQSATIYTNQTVSKTNVTANQTLQASVPRKTFTCTKQYRLQNADGSYPSSYTNDGTVTAYYGGSCSYSKPVSYYTTQSASKTNVTANQTLQVSLPRTTYALTVNRNTTYISSASGAGTYRWGQTISISATAASTGEFTSWSQTAGTTSSFGSTTSASTTFVMPKSAATVYANGQVISMQNFTLAKCTTSGVTIRDSRDGEQYFVKKLSDGKCWMQDNLRFSDHTFTMTSANTNITSGRTYKFPNASTAWTSDGSYTEAWFNANMKNNTATKYGSGSNKRGVYYNFCAASAGSYCYAEGSGTGNASQDICPAGWRLPTGGSSGEFQALYNAYGNKSSFYSAFNNILSGDWAKGINWGSESYGNFWSSTRANGSNMYDLYAPKDDSVGTQDNFNRFDGFSVRCVLK